jgi:prevent-host-death family protein
MDTSSVWTYIVSMKRVAAAKFKEQCLSILDRLDPQGIVITKHGRPVARLLPIEHASAELVGSLRGRIRVTGDLLSTGVKWTAGD